MNFSKSIKVFAIFAASFLLFSCKEELPKRTVRIAIQPSAGFIPMYVARYSNLIENALAEKNVTVEWQDFESDPVINDSLSADLSDIGLLGDVPAILSLMNTNKMYLVGIASRGAEAYAVLAKPNDTSIKSLKDIKNKRIATVFGSTGHEIVKNILDKNGLTFDDIEFVNISAADFEYALRVGTADAIVTWEPNISRLVDSDKAKIISTGKELNTSGVNSFIVRESYLAAGNADIIKEILNQYKIASEQLASLDQKVLLKLCFVLNINTDQISAVTNKYDFSVNISKNDINSLKETMSFLISINSLNKNFQIENKIYSSCLPSN